MYINERSDDKLKKCEEISNYLNLIQLDNLVVQKNARNVLINKYILNVKIKYTRKFTEHFPSLDQVLN